MVSMVNTFHLYKNFLQSVTHFARKTSRIKQKPLAFGRLKKPPSIVDMSYYVTNENSFLDIKNAHLRVTGNVHTDVLKVGSIGFQPTGSNIPGTINFTNVTTGVTTSSNLDVGGTLNLGTVELSASTHTLDHITARGNVTSTTVQFDNATTGLVTTANVEVGGELTVSGNATVSENLTVSSNLIVTGNVIIGGYQLTSMFPGFASGGDDVYDIDGYRIHVFTNSGTFNVPGANISADVLVVGGGGGGGQDNAGGGGSGGLIFKPSHTFAGRGASGGRDGYYVITIGTGGSGSISQAAVSATAGNNTVIRPGRDPTVQNATYLTDYPVAIFTAKGGGPGDQSATYRPTTLDGGSGGGGQDSEGDPGHAGGTETQTGLSGDSGTYGHGNNGGTGADDGGGGGGGAGAVGQNGDVLFDGAGGNGGDGLNGIVGYDFAEIFGTRYGEVVNEDVYFAGGGGGANRNNINSGYAGGGKGGGGSAGGTPQTNENGLPGTGGGGAGAIWNTEAVNGNNYLYNIHGGDGGSGIVIIRYQL